MSTKPNDNAKWLFCSVVVLAATLLILTGHAEVFWSIIGVFVILVIISNL